MFRRHEERRNERSALDDAFIRELLANGNFRQVPYTTKFRINGPSNFVVYGKTDDGWAQMAQAHLQDAMRSRGPNSTTALFRSIFEDLVDPAQYEGLKKQLMTREDKQAAFNAMFGDALGAVGNDAKLGQDLFASLFGQDDPVTGLYKKATQPAYAMVLKLPRGMNAQDIFAPVPPPPPEPTSFMPPAEKLREILQAAQASAPSAPPPEETTFPFSSEQDTPPPKTRLKPQPDLVEEDNPPPYIDPQTILAPQPKPLITQDPFSTGDQIINQVFPITTEDMGLMDTLAL